MSTKPRKVPPGRSLAENASPELLAQWDQEKNSDLTPWDVTFKSGKKAWWKCSQEHQWEAKISNLINREAPPQIITVVGLPYW